MDAQYSDAQNLPFFSLYLKCTPFSNLGIKKITVEEIKVNVVINYWDEKKLGDRPVVRG